MPAFFNKEKKRLVAQPWILDPEICSSADWKAIIAEFKKVALDVFTFEVDEAESLIHQFTFGIKRLVVQLLVCAYKVARKQGKYTVDVDEIRQAYMSSLYTSNREDVEILWRQCIEKKMIQEGLWCPFDQTHDDVTVDEFQFVSQGSQANSKATALLLQLLGIGPRLVYVANYSLGHKLKRRNQEDKQTEARFSVKPMVNISSMIFSMKEPIYHIQGKYRCH